MAALAVGLAAVLGSTALTAGAGAVTVSKAAPGSRATTSRFWSQRRMERARPLELVRDAGGEPALRRATPPPFTSAPVASPTTPPMPTNGKLFGKLPRLGLFECSATVLDSAGGSVIFTAGHCVYDPQTGISAKRLAFVPAYANGVEPFGRWSYARALATRPWVRRGNSNFDYAAILLRPQGTTPVESVVGGRQMVVNNPRAMNYSAVGYPVNFNNAQVMWQCTGSYAGDDPHPIPQGPLPVGMGCDMKAGASGGGWFNDVGQLVSVTSFGYRRRPGFLYGPYLTPKAASLAAAAEAP